MIVKICDEGEHNKTSELVKYTRRLLNKHYEVSGRQIGEFSG